MVTETIEGMSFFQQQSILSVLNLPLSQMKKEFDANKLYCTEILSILLQNSDGTLFLLILIITVVQCAHHKCLFTL